MTTFEIRCELADLYNVNPGDVKCFNCECWGYNRGKVMNDMGESKCMRRKNKHTWSRQFCRGFIPKK